MYYSRAFAMTLSECIAVRRLPHSKIYRDGVYFILFANFVGTPLLESPHNILESISINYSAS